MSAMTTRTGKKKEDEGGWLQIDIRFDSTMES